MCCHKQANTFLVFFSLVCLQIGNQTFTAHILNNLFRCIECALILVILQQVFKNTSEHFGVNTHFRIVWVVFINGKIVLRKHCQQVIKIAGRKMTRFFVKNVTFKQTTVQIWNTTITEAFYFSVVKIALI